MLNQFIIDKVSDNSTNNQDIDNNEDLERTVTPTNHLSQNVNQANTDENINLNITQNQLDSSLNPNIHSTNADFDLDFTYMTLFFLSKEILLLASLKLNSTRAKDELYLVLENYAKMFFKLLKLKNKRNKFLIGRKSHYAKLLSSDVLNRYKLLYIKDCEERKVQDDLFCENNPTINKVLNLLIHITELKRTNIESFADNNQQICSDSRPFNVLKQPDTNSNTNQNEEDDLALFDYVEQPISTSHALFGYNNEQMLSNNTQSNLFGTSSSIY